MRYSRLQFSVDCSWRLNPTLYEQRISRNFDRAFKQFKQEQAERKAQEEHQLAHAADLKAHHDEQQAMSPQPLPYISASDGFVFSNSFIDAWAQRENRYQRAHFAAKHRLRAAAA